jgi:hypothetical protein
VGQSKIYRKKKAKSALTYQKQLRFARSFRFEDIEKANGDKYTRPPRAGPCDFKIKPDKLETVKISELLNQLNEIRGLISQTIESARSLTSSLASDIYELGFEAASSGFSELYAKEIIRANFTDASQSA